MSDSLLIVESPAKVKTIKKYLGPDFIILPSMGHVKDLPKSTLGIDAKNSFEPTYQIIENKKKIINDIKKAAQKVEHIYLSPDPDREGEAIAWHIAEEIGTKGKNIHRVLFNDLTKNTVLDAIKHPQKLDFNKYEAQQTRRILDRLVGYRISPILWEKVKRGLSAGRVQSVAVRLIREREDEIQKFLPEEYWNITALLEGAKPPSFEARLIKVDGKKAKVPEEQRAKEVLEDMKAATFLAEKVVKKETKRSPLPPFTTSKLQQESFRWLHFPPKKTMRVAQQLYEGIELGGEGSVGLITYMRTDSFRIADDALREVREYIKKHYDAPYLPAKPRFFKNKGRVQDAHEAIRPSSMNYTPQDVKAHLSPDQFRLYQLIWNRFIASQMNPAVFDQTTIDIGAGRCHLRAQGSVMKFPGFTIVYTESKDDAENGEESEFGKTLPDITEGERLTLISLTPEQKFTQPPPRFTEASLVRELEEKGIGRPSTYATIISVIQDRAYVRIEKGKIFPTDLGILVTDLLVKNFPRILDVDFTASMETQLDMVEEGKAKRVDVLSDFYGPFDEELKKAHIDMKNGQPTDFICDKCGSPMVIKWGKNGRFIACSNYPSCKNTMKMNEQGTGTPLKQEAEMTDISCTVCGKNMVIRGGKFGKFLGCSGYPGCKNTVNLPGEEQKDTSPAESALAEKTVCTKCGKPMLLRQGKFGKFLGCSGYPQCRNVISPTLGIKCPSEGCTGEISEKGTRTGRAFYGCTRYPKCKITFWDRPIPESCPQCGSPFLLERRTVKKHLKTCPTETCGYKSAME